MPLFTISYLRNAIKAKVVTLDSILKLGVDERERQVTSKVNLLLSCWVNMGIMNY